MQVRLTKLFGRKLPASAVYLSFRFISPDA
jgi:hypothetical protein